MKSINKLTQCAITFATLLPLATLAPDAQANLLQTGDFELGHDVLLSSGPVTDSHLIPNWTFSDYGVQAFAQITTSFSTCSTGQCFVAIRFHDSGGRLSQTFGASAGQRLKIDFDYASFAASSDQGSGTLASTLSAALNGQELDSLTLDNPIVPDRAQVPFNHYTGYATAADINTFEVDYFLSNTSHLYLDNFRITVPEPNTSALALGALLALYVAGRRRSA